MLSKHRKPLELVDQLGSHSSIEPNSLAGFGASRSLYRNARGWPVGSESDRYLSADPLQPSRNRNTGSEKHGSNYRGPVAARS